MAKTIKITPEMSVRDINIEYPQCREVFNTHGMGGCGGQFGPPEPIGFFAESHRVPVEVLIADLEAAAAGSQAEASEETDAEKLSAKLYKRFVKMALFFTLTLGTVWGVINLTQIALNKSFTAPSASAIQAHGHAQTLGWVGLFIMGVAYYTIPKFKGVELGHLRAAALSLPLMAVAIIVRALAQPFATNAAWGFTAFAASAVEMVAILLFVWLMLDVVKRSEQKPEFHEKFITAGLVWFVVLGVLDLAATYYLWQHRTNIVPPAYNLRVLHTEMFGFIVNVILGVSLRILPNFLGLRQPVARAANAAFWLFNASVALRIAGLEPMAVSSALELIGAAAFVYAIGIFAKPAAEVNIEGVDNAFGWFIKLGYFWLMVTGVMIFAGDLYTLLTGAALPHAYVGSYRHAITVGFISTLMIGVAYRILPIFNGTQLYSPRAMRVSFWLLAIGNLFRVGWQLGTISGSTAMYALTGVSGYLELTAMSIFAWNVVKTLRTVEEPGVTGTLIEPSTKVADVLRSYPGARQVLVEAGLTHMAGTATPPGFVTIDFAAKRHGLDTAALVDRLNDMIHQQEAA